MIIDCAIFFDEFDLLELRFRELDRVVDRFVVVEATTTFSGKEKPLNFAENNVRFAEWIHRIDHVVVREMAGPSAWDREFHQRNAILRALADRSDDDVIMISDVDEIPKASTVPRWLPRDLVMIFDQSLAYYALNCRSLTERWRGTRAASLATVRKLTPQGIRNVGAADGSSAHFVQQDGGWHFSYLGGPDAIAKKIDAFSHQEFNTPERNDKKRIAASIASRVDLFDRPAVYEVVPLDSSFPDAVRNNPSHWSRHIMEERHSPPGAMPKVSIITPWIDHPEFIRDYEVLTSAADQVVVIDNGSALEHARALRAMCARLPRGSYLRNDVNAGFARSNNQGLSVADGEIVVFLNNDVVGAPDWVGLLRKVVRAGTLYASSSGSQFVYGLTLPFLGGWCLAGTIADFRRLGGWNEDYVGPYWEDNDLSLRALRVGMGLMTLELKIRHLGGRTTGASLKWGESYEMNRSRFAASVRSFIEESKAGDGK